MNDCSLQLLEVLYILCREGLASDNTLRDTRRLEEHKEVRPPVTPHDRQ